MWNLKAFVLERDIWNFIYVFFKVLLSLLLKKVFVFGVNLTNVFKAIHILLWFIKAKLEGVSKIIEDSFVLKVNEESLLILYFIFDILDYLPILLSKKYFRVVLSILQRIYCILVRLFLQKASVLDTVEKSCIEVHSIFG